MPSCTYNSIARIGGTLILRGAAEIGVDDYSPNNRSVGKDNRALSSSVRERTARGVLRDDSSEGSHGEKMWRAPPPSFCYCPLTMVVMKDPVQDREGNSYEKAAIVKWLSENTTSPITRNRLRMKHLVPNRALKEAIDFEVRKYMKYMTNNEERIPRLTRPATSATSVPDKCDSKPSTKNHHHQIINKFLSSLNVKSRLDNFGIAFLPMEKLQPTINNEKIKMLMIIEAPQGEAFQLSTHFNYVANIAPSEGVATGSAGASSKENQVLWNSLLQHGKHKALSLTKVCDERMKFSFEGKNSDISSMSKVKEICNTFVKVAFRMKKRIET